MVNIVYLPTGYSYPNIANETSKRSFEIKPNSYYVWDGNCSDKDKVKVIIMTAVNFNY